MRAREVIDTREAFDHLVCLHDRDSEVSVTHVESKYKSDNWVSIRIGVNKTHIGGLALRADGSIRPSTSYRLRLEDDRWQRALMAIWAEIDRQSS